MTPQFSFQIFNFIALCSWILLIFFGASKISRVLIHSTAIPLLLALGYWVSLMSMFLTNPPAGAGFGSLEALQALFSNPWGLLAGWVHYLAFDLLIGSEIERRYRNRNFFLRLILLFLTFMFGPIGWSLSKVFDRRKL